MHTGGICLQNLMGEWCVVRTEMNSRFERNKFPVSRFNSDTTKHFSVDGLETTFCQDDDSIPPILTTAVRPKLLLTPRAIGPLCTKFPSEIVFT